MSCAGNCGRASCLGHVSPQLSWAPTKLQGSEPSIAHPNPLSACEENSRRRTLRHFVNMAQRLRPTLLKRELITVSNPSMLRDLIISQPAHRKRVSAVFTYVDILQGPRRTQLSASNRPELRFTRFPSAGGWNEVEQYLSFYSMARKQGDSFEEGIATALRGNPGRARVSVPD